MQLFCLFVPSLCTWNFRHCCLLSSYTTRFGSVSMCEDKYIRNLYTFSWCFMDVLTILQAFTAAFCHQFYFAGVFFRFCFTLCFGSTSASAVSFFCLFVRLLVPMDSFFFFRIVVSDTHADTNIHQHITYTQANKIVENIWICVFVCMLVRLSILLVTAFDSIWHIFHSFFFFFLCLSLSLSLQIRIHFADAFGASTRKRMAGYFAASSLLTGWW